MASTIITPDDLQNFKRELLEEIQKLLSQTQSAPVKKWLKSTELRKMIPVSAGTLQNLRVNGTLPFTKIGGVIFYDRSDVEKMIGEHQGYSHFTNPKRRLK
jgi:hypothetical protein